MVKPIRPITEREAKLIQLYAYCQLGMTPQEFYAKWDVDQDDIALICDRSKGTVQRWFCRGRTRRHPTVNDLRHLALCDFLLEHFEDIPEKLRNLVCSPNRRQ
jgi:hypothetical protein